VAERPGLSKRRLRFRELALRMQHTADACVHTSAPPVGVKRTPPAVYAPARAYRRTFAASPVFRRSWGTIPAVHLLPYILGIPTGLPGERVHSDSESSSSRNFFQGIAADIWFLALAAIYVRPPAPAAAPLSVPGEVAL
jgi:hypothetical protein